MILQETLCICQITNESFQTSWSLFDDAEPPALIPSGVGGQDGTLTSKSA